MLLIDVGRKEAFDHETEEFVYLPGKVYSLEHSLWTIAQWETIYKKPFLVEQELSLGEYQAYVNLMSKDGPIDLELLDEEQLKTINEYIFDKLTATRIKEIGESGRSASYTTSETLYATMTIARIPWEAQHWHLSRLVTLIKVINEYTGDKKKMSPQEVMQQNRELNKQRRAELNTKG